MSRTPLTLEPANTWNTSPVDRRQLSQDTDTTGHWETYNSSLLKIGGHDNGFTAVLPHHSPEIFHSAIQRPLCGNVLPWMVLVALHDMTDRGRQLLASGCQRQALTLI